MISQVVAISSEIIMKINEYQVLADPTTRYSTTVFENNFFHV